MIKDPFQLIVYQHQAQSIIYIIIPLRGLIGEEFGFF